MRRTVGDKNRKCSLDQTVTFNRRFGSAVAANEGMSFVDLHGPRYSKEAVPELEHSLAVTPACGPSNFFFFSSFSRHFNLVLLFTVKGWVTPSAYEELHFLNNTLLITGFKKSTDNKGSILIVKMQPPAQSGPLHRWAENFVLIDPPKVFGMRHISNQRRKIYQLICPVILYTDTALYWTSTALYRTIQPCVLRRFEKLIVLD